MSIFVFVEEEVVFARIVRPDVFDAFVDLSFVFDLLQVLDHFQRGARTDGIVDQLVFGSGPGRIFEFGCQFKCSVHSSRVFVYSLISGGPAAPVVPEFAKVIFFSGYVLSCILFLAAILRFYTSFPTPPFRLRAGRLPAVGGAARAERTMQYKIAYNYLVFPDDMRSCIELAGEAPSSALRRAAKPLGGELKIRRAY